MSIEAMTACWGSEFPARAEGLSPQTVRLVALAVADVVNDMHGFRFYAARKKVAEKVGCDPDTVGDVMKHLVSTGVLEVVSCQPGRPVEYLWKLGVSDPEGVRSSTAPLRSSTAGGAVTSPHRNTNGYSTKTAPTASEIYGATPLTPEEIAEKYGVEL